MVAKLDAKMSQIRLGNPQPLRKLAVPKPSLEAINVRKIWKFTLHLERERRSGGLGKGRS